MNVSLLSKLRVKVIYLCAGVPNTTAITQETDQSFGYFKTLSCRKTPPISTNSQETILDLHLILEYHLLLLKLDYWFLGERTTKQKPAIIETYLQLPFHQQEIKLPGLQLVLLHP